MKLDYDKIASEILKITPIITSMSPEIIFLYDGSNGYYNSKNSVQILKRSIQSIVGNPSNNQVNEIIDTIKRETYKDIDVYDNGDSLIVIKNGLLNAETGEFQNKYTSKKFITWRLPVYYNSEIGYNGFLKYVNQLTATYDDTLTLQEAFGNIFANHYETKKLLFIYGGHDSGKSTFFNIITDFLGGILYGNYSTLNLYQCGEKFTNALLYGKRVNIVSDISYKLPVNNYSIIKSLTGGDGITVQEKQKKPFTFHNKAKLFFNANGIPSLNMNYVDDAFLNRFQFMHFPNQFTPDETIRGIYNTSKMKSQILNWMIEGYQRLKNNKWKFTNHNTIEDVKKILLIGNISGDTFLQWLDDNCEKSDAYIPTKKLFDNCVEWHKENGCLSSCPDSIDEFGHKINKQSIIPVTKHRYNDEQCYKGIVLKEDLLNAFGI